MVNKHPIRCCYCKAEVPAGGGNIWRWRGRWYGAHLACKREKRAEVSTVYFPSTGTELHFNRNGRCEDAPCCGCCSY
jgi:hypothetical protein